MVAAQIHDGDDRPEPRQHVGYRHLRTETARWMKCAQSNHKEEQMRNAGVHERCLQAAERLSSILGAVRDCRRRCMLLSSPLTTAIVMVFGRRQQRGSAGSTDRRPKSAKARSRGKLGAG